MTSRATRALAAAAVLGALTLMATIAQAAAARHKPRNRCAGVLRHEHVIRANRTAFVYSGSAYAAPSESDLDAGVCLRANGRHWHLDGNGSDTLLEDFHLRGRYFVWTDQLLSGPASVPGYGTIYLVDLLRRKKLVISAVVDGGGPGGPYPGGSYHGASSVPSSAIGPHGEFAWIGSADAFFTAPGQLNPSPHYEVWFSHSGKSTKFDAGPDIAPRSVRLSADGLTISWQRAGQTRTARAP